MTETRNLPASVEARLKRIAAERGEDFQFVLNRYARERLLYRLSRSVHAEEFLLKGATLFQIWTADDYRPTRDVDFLGFGPNGVSSVVGRLEAIVATTVEADGLEFVRGSVRGELIRESQAYEGVRIKLLARLGRAEIDLVVDVGFGDAVTPGPRIEKLPVMLDFPAPALRAYPMESVIAEKYEAMVRFGIANSRMKDFYDVCVLATRFEFAAGLLGLAIRNTFDRRGTTIPVDLPTALTDVFANDRAKIRLWKAFLERIGAPAQVPEWADVIALLRDFLGPVSRSASSGVVVKAAWRPGRGWMDSMP